MEDHFFLEDKDHSKLFIKILQGGALGPDSTPLCGRVDVLVEANKMKEAFLLHIVTTEIDKVREFWVDLAEETAVKKASTGNNRTADI